MKNSAVFIFIINFLFLVVNGKTLKAEDVNNEWWKTTTVYQIYPRSWLDTDGDGRGDLQGVIDKLDYLQDLGYETIWISPFTESPQKDFGYDISDYRKISEQYGSMEIFERLLSEVHKRGMRLVLDMVMNHTSNEHAWFKESASSRDNPKADWYIWKDGRGKDGLKRPNNWRAMSGNWAWTYHEERKQFYYNAFLPFQPDLNYNNPDVKKEMFDIVRFWLSKGVDGFRLDIISAIYEDPKLTDNPSSSRMTPSDKSLTIFFQELKNNFLQEKSFGFSTELREVIDEFDHPKRVLIGESHGHESILKKFCTYEERDGLHLIFMFNAISMPFKATDYKTMTETFEKYFPDPLMPTLVFANHDRNRTISRLGGSVEKAKLLAMYQFTARGVPFTYFGEEIGIPRVRIPLKDGKDPIAQQNNWLPQFLVDKSIEILNRDECRTPMLWNDKANAGFTSEHAQPWLPIAENYREINVETQKTKPDSQYNFFKKILALRKSTLALQKGSLEIAYDLCNKKTFAYYRILNDERFLIVLNMSKSSIKDFNITGELLLSTHLASQQGVFQPFEGKVFRVQ